MFRIRAQRRKFNEEGWQFINDDEIEENYPCSNAKLKKDISRNLTRLQCFEVFLTPAILEKVVSHMKSNTSIFKIKNELDVPKFKKYLACMMYLNHHEEIASIKELYSKKKPHREHMIISRDWYYDINKSIDFDLNEIKNEFDRNMEDNFAPGQQSTIDEVILAHFGDSSLLVKLPKKPHPVGILTWTHCQRLGQYPLLLRFLVRSEDKRYNVGRIVAELLQLRHSRAHVSADCWFNTKDSREWLMNNNVEFTMSTSKKVFPYLWKVLAHHTGFEQTVFAWMDRLQMSAEFYKGGESTLLLSTHFEKLNDDAFGETDLKTVYNNTSHYCDNFNEIFYKWPKHHKKYSDRQVIFDGLFRFCFVNCRTLYYKLNNIDNTTETVRQFREALLSEMLEEYV